MLTYADVCLFSSAKAAHRAGPSTHSEMAGKSSSEGATQTKGYASRLRGWIWGGGAGGGGGGWSGGGGEGTRNDGAERGQTPGTYLKPKKKST